MLYKKINLTKRYKNIALLCKISRPLLFSNRKCILYCGFFSKPPDKNVLTGDSELKSKPSAHVERWVLRLQAYHFKVVYRPGKTNIADALSRLNCGFQSNDGEDYDFVHAVVENRVPCALTPAEIEKASAENMELNLIK